MRAMIGSLSRPASMVPANGSTTLTVTVAARIGSDRPGLDQSRWPELDNDLHFAYYAHVGP